MMRYLNIGFVLCWHTQYVLHQYIQYALRHHTNYALCQHTQYVLPTHITCATDMRNDTQRIGSQQ